MPSNGMVSRFSQKKNKERSTMKMYNVKIKQHSTPFLVVWSEIYRAKTKNICIKTFLQAF